MENGESILCCCFLRALECDCHGDPLVVGVETRVGAQDISGDCGGGAAREWAIDCAVRYGGGVDRVEGNPLRMLMSVCVVSVDTDAEVR